MQKVVKYFFNFLIGAGAFAAVIGVDIMDGVIVPVWAGLIFGGIALAIISYFTRNFVLYVWDLIAADQSQRRRI